MIEIDGSFGSGGGQILRTAISLSAITGKDCRIFNIRQGREKPGLATQHLLGIQAVAQLCGGKLEGDFLGSQEVKFSPGKIQTKDLRIKIETAGSIALILQTLIPLALFASSPIKITFEGGATDTFFSPTMDYFRFVFLKILERAGLKAEINILKRGYYPEGGAGVEVKVYPVKIKSIVLTEKGKLKKILIISGASEFLKDKKVAERQVAGAKEVLGKLKLPLEERIEYYDTRCPGSQICLVAEFENTVIGTDNLGKLGKRAEDVGKEAALELLKEDKSGACLDKHMADQILPYMALANQRTFVLLHSSLRSGKEKSQFSVSEITNHAKTNTWVIEKFIDGKFEIKDNLIIWNHF